MEGILLLPNANSYLREMVVTIIVIVALAMKVKDWLLAGNLESALNLSTADS